MRTTPMRKMHLILWACALAVAIPGVSLGASTKAQCSAPRSICEAAQAVSKLTQPAVAKPGQQQATQGQSPPQPASQSAAKGNAPPAAKVVASAAKPAPPAEAKDRPNRRAVSRAC